MLGFMEWVEYDRKKKEKEKKNVQSTDQGSAEVRYVYQQGKVDRNPEAIEHQGIYYLPEP
jgi:hypothetical protein